MRKREGKALAAFIAVWVMGLLFVAGVWTVVIWAIIRLVQWITAQ